MKNLHGRKLLILFLAFALAVSCPLSVAALEMTYEPSDEYKQSGYYAALTDIELTGHYPTDILNVAMSQLGYHEGDTLADLGGYNIFGKQNQTEYGAFHSLQADWCAMFISWCARQAQIPCEAFYSNGFASAYDFGLEYKSKAEYTPKMGDIIIFDWEIDGFCMEEPAGEHGDHVGIVYYVDEEYVFYVDGNFGNRVSKHYTPLDDINIKGYGLCPVGAEIVYDEPLFIGSTGEAEKTCKVPDEEPGYLSGTYNSFDDVSEGDYFYNAVMWALATNRVSGVSENSFAPYSDCSRAEVVTFLWKACGYQKPTVSDCPFVDVDADAYYYEALLWCYENGYVNGTDENSFSPALAADRAQIVTILHRMAGSPKSGAECPFKDVDAQSYYYDAVLWAVERGVTDGTSETTFDPHQTCNRAQMITFLYRIIQG